MKDRNRTTSKIDSILAVIQAFLFAIVPVVLVDKVELQHVAYLSISILYLLYFFLCRDWLINRLIQPSGIDTEVVLEYNLASKLRDDIIPRTKEIQDLSFPTDIFKQYALFIEWQYVATFMEQHFWSNESREIKNTVLIPAKQISLNKIYRFELEQIINVLINSYEANGKFENVLRNCNCGFLSRKVAEIAKNIYGIYTELNQ